MTDHKENFAHLFTAHISSAFLDILDFPASPPPLSVQESISIQRICVPLRPYKTFRLRLFPLLLDPHNTYLQADKTAQPSPAT